MNSAVRKSAVVDALVAARAERTVSAQADAQVQALAQSRAVGRLIKQVFSSLLRNIDERMQPFGLTAMQWEPLMLIHFERADTVAALARESQVGCGSMTRMLDRLERKTLLRRRRSSVDRRVVHLELTPKGKRSSARFCRSSLPSSISISKVFPRRT